MRENNPMEKIKFTTYKIQNKSNINYRIRWMKKCLIRFSNNI